MHRLRLPAKFTIIAVAFLAPLLVALYGYCIDSGAQRVPILSLVALCVVSAVYLMMSFYLSSSRGFGAVRTRLDKISRHHSGFDFPARGHDEIGMLINALNGLQELVGGIRSSASYVSGSAEQLASVSSEMTEHQQVHAAAIGETVASVKQISVKVQTNLDSSSHASGCAEEAFAVATRGKELVDRVVGTMQAITGSTRRIGDIISVIDEIAFQTNLLALNASVEAARAGEQGRGFAVVAAEVRNLAQRAAAAASEIKKLVGASIQDVDRGAILVGSAGGTMNEILGSVSKVTEIMSQIANASRTQAQDIGRINSAVERIERGTGESAQLLEQIAVVASALQEQVQFLMSAAEVFGIASEHAPARTVEAARAVNTASATARRVAA